MIVADYNYRSEIIFPPLDYNKHCRKVVQLEVDDVLERIQVVQTDKGIAIYVIFLKPRTDLLGVG